MHGQFWKRLAAALVVVGLFAIGGCKSGGIVAGDSGKVHSLSTITLSKPCSGTTKTYHLQTTNGGSKHVQFKVTIKSHSVSQALAVAKPLVAERGLDAGASHKFDAPITESSEVYVYDLTEHGSAYLYLGYDCK